MGYDLPELNFPIFEFEIVQDQQGTKIFDRFRKLYVVLTPEEWVRQNMAMYITEVLNYPASLMAIEMGLKVNGLMKRADIVVHNKKGEPWMIVECKSNQIKRIDDAAHQASSYSLGLDAKYLVITNGIKHFCYQFQEGAYQIQKSFPSYE